MARYFENIRVESMLLKELVSVYGIVAEVPKKKEKFFKKRPRTDNVVFKSSF